ncbi:MAG: histidinol-phosphate transaminase [Deferrisomatales bacterium]|nr:histidinol-phosphate transaminase [Deferrisomatales bacterium]
MSPTPAPVGADLFEQAVSPQVLDLKPYVPGKPIEELRRERGLATIVKLASNENPLGPSPAAVAALEGELARLHRYPDGYGFALKHALARRWGVGPENLVLGNGSSEILEMVVRLLVRPGRGVVLASPSFSIYELTARAQGGGVRRVPLRGFAVDLEAVAEAVDETTALVILGNPNNPTGTIFRRREWERFLGRVSPRVGILLDEAYAEYAEDPEFPVGREYLDEGRLLIAVRTFSKAHGLASLRIGYGIAPRRLVDYMNRLRLPFNANGPAQAAAAAAVDDDAHVGRSREVNRQGVLRLARFFEGRGVSTVPSQANFVLARVGDGDGCFEALLGEGVIVRSARSFGLPDWIRVTAGTPEELAVFETAFDRAVAAVGGMP